MKLVQVAEQNKPYYSADYTKGFNDGAKRQYAADVAEVKHGRWTFDIDDRGWSWNKPYTCDQCGEWVEKKFNFCPNCGARMLSKCVECKGGYCEEECLK